MRAPVFLALVLSIVPIHVVLAGEARVGVRSIPSGRSILFDGVAFDTPFDRVVLDSSTHTLDVITPQDIAPGKRAVFDHWNPPGDPVARSFTFTARAGSSIYTSEFRTQYAVTLALVPGGRIVPGPGTTWLDADSSFAIDAVPFPGFSFGEWVGDGEGSYSGRDPAQRLVVRAPIHEHASFAIDTIKATVETIPHGLAVAIDGVPHITPFTLTQQANVGILLDAPESQDVAGSNVHFVAWSDGGPRAHMTAPSVNTTFVVRYEPAPGRSWITAAWPNPSRETSRFELVLGTGGPAAVSIHNLSGRIVRHLVDWPMEAGIHPVSWDGKDDRGQPVPSGIYFARAQWAGFEGQERVVRLR